MRESEAIISAYDLLKKEGHACVLATVVQVEGSSYRRAGARMLIAENGRMTGSISGGCLEGDALKKALLALHQGRNKLVTYDTNDEEDAVVGAQLGCNGVIQVLFEPIRYEQADNPVELLRLAEQQTETCAIAVLYCLQKDKKQAGTTALFDQNLNVHASFGHEIQASNLKSLAKQTFEAGQSRFLEIDGDEGPQQVFMEICRPAPQLVLVGAGNDALPPAQMAALLGWKVIIADGRATHATTQRFGPVCRLIVTKPEQLLENIRIDNRTAFVLMTHNYPYDLAVLKLLLRRPETPYIGILGPRKKYLRMLDELAAEGIFPGQEQESRIFSPIGLDLGAENAAEIGISLLAEILGVLNGATVGHLRARKGPIHAR